MDSPRELEPLLAVIRSLPDPVFVITAKGRLARVVGGGDPERYREPSALLGRTLFDLLPPEKAAWFLAQIRLALTEGRLRAVEYDLEEQDQAWLGAGPGPRGTRWFEGRIQPLESPCDGERAVVWVPRDVTRRYELAAELRRQSVTDELTGLANRRQLYDELHRSFQLFRRYGQPIAFVMLDVDHFKRVNDRLGHVAGDSVLRHLAGVLRAELRDVDVVARYGGEEFSVLLPSTTLEAASVVAERLRAAVVARPCPQPDGALAFTISLGASALHEDDASEDAVMKRADGALYEAKEAGRNRVVCRAR